jgi:hypothetical protein
MASRSWVDGFTAGKFTDKVLATPASVRVKRLPRTWPSLIPFPNPPVWSPNVPKAGAQGGVRVGLGVKVFGGVRVFVTVGVDVGVAVAVMVGVAVAKQQLG